MPTKLNYEILNVIVGYYTSYIIHKVIFRPHWLKPFSIYTKYNAKSSLNKKWRPISMERFHFSEQRFPRIGLNSSHCLCSTLYLVHTWLPPYQFPMIPSLFYHNTYFSWREFWGCNQLEWLWHSFVCLVAPEDDDQLPLMVSCWCPIDLLTIFFFVSQLYTDLHAWTF